MKAKRHKTDKHGHFMCSNGYHTDVVVGRVIKHQLYCNKCADMFLGVRDTSGRLIKQ